MKNKKYPNLRPWRPGQSGNPAGRKYGSKNMSTIVRELLDQEADADVLAKSSVAELTQGKSTTYVKAVVWAAIQKALQGNMQAIIWLAEQQGWELDSVAQEERYTREPKIISNIKPRYPSSTVDKQ